MSYTNPNGWGTPRTTLGGPPSVPTTGNSGAVSGVDWASSYGVSDVDLKRIETNVAGLHTLLCQSGTVDTFVDTPHFSAKVEATWNWTRINNIVFLGIPLMESPTNLTGDELQIEPDTTWPSEILPDEDTIVPCIFTVSQNDTYTSRPGYMVIPSTNNAAIVCYITKYFGNPIDPLSDTDGCFVPDYFWVDNTGPNKAIPSQTVTYMVDRPVAVPAPATTTSTTTGAP